MPFLKPQKMTVTKSRIEACKRNGSRGSIFSPVSSSKLSYSGEWKNDKKQGKGTELDERRGLLYEGDWFNGKKHGHGEQFRILPDKSRARLYSGNWKNGKNHGFGRLWKNEAGFYEGFFRNGERHGFGRMWQADDTFYQGTWKNDFYHGEGMLVLANGNRFEGFFANGKKQGRGTFYHIKTGQLQDGFWLADKCVISTLEDISWRQSAPLPTPYPIPQNGLTNIQEIVEKRVAEYSMFQDPELSSFSAHYEDYTREDCY